MKPLASVPSTPPLLTTTSPTPAVPAPVVAVICVAVTVPTVAATPLILTVGAPEKFVPVIVTAVPPAIVPCAGLIEVTVGIGGEATVMLTVAGAEVPPALVAVKVKLSGPL